MKNFLILIVALIAAGTPAPAAAQAQDADGVWTVAPAGALRTDSVRALINGPQMVVTLNRAALDARLALAPREDAAGRIAGGEIEISLPLPEGGFGRFRVAESPILAPELEAQFPAFKTYVGRGLDDPTATARFDWTEAGFHAIVLRGAGTVLVDPEVRGDLAQYVAYRKIDASQNAQWICLTDGQSGGDALRTVNTFPITNGTQKRTYRLALAATGEYTAAAGGTKPLALSRMTTTINRVNGVYERDLAVHLTLATGTNADPTALIYTDGTTDPYTNNDGATMLGENQTNIDAVVGDANYDVGHVFSTGGGGIATLQVPCVTGSKARGVTGLPNPVGDAFDIDYVAHEMGHQFGANHTFNATSGNCVAPNISTPHAFEVGSGITVMAYAGICTPQDLALHSIDNFHFESLNEITAFLTSGSGSTCGTVTATGNNPPTPGATANYTIPARTPFALTATGTPFNGGNTLTYNWEEYDLGSSSADVAGATTDSGNRPLLRPYSSTTTGTRMFPSLTYILNNANTPPSTYTCVGGGTCLTGETLPTTSRTMTFQVTLRDNNAGAGAIATTSMQVTTVATAGPFAVTAPNTAVSWTGGTTQSVTWTVANTSGAPVNAANVKISLSTDGGSTFPTVLAASAPNNGSASITVPNTPTTTARIKVEAVGNIFFDISDTNFTIVAGVGGPTITSQPASQSIAPGATATLSVAASGTSLSYQWFMGASGVTSSPVGTNSPSYTTPALVNNTRYWVRVSNSGGSVNSNTATITVTFTDATLTAGVTPIMAVHITELRTRINGLRARYSLAAFSFTGSITPGTTVITPQQVVEMRTALTQAYAAAGAGTPTFTDPTITAGTTPIKAVHIVEIRTKLTDIE